LSSFLSGLQRHPRWLAPNVALKLPAHALEAAGSLRSPAALFLERRSLTPAR
jgi:hypothetical protein